MLKNCFATKIILIVQDAHESRIKKLYSISMLLDINFKVNKNFFMNIQTYINHWSVMIRNK